jgi:phage shock protein PspC (stress-responsive transcriptional regulator)
MKKVININFQGRVVPIEENAYDILKQYVESLRRYFANEEGKDEIINDIESRIAELFAETLKKGSTCITDEDVNNIIKSMGRPEDFDDEEAKVHSQLGSNPTEETHYTKETFTSGRRRLYRDENNKVLGGVCSGIANYFGIDPLVIRILAVLVTPFFFWPYLILWIAIPSTATQVIGSSRKRLLRDMDDKIIGGVCSGLGHYFGIKVWIPRVLFLVPFLSFVTQWHHWGLFGFPHFMSLSFSPGATVIYIILWMVLPEAVTSADKLEMKGERVDLNSIKNTIQTDMEGFKGRAEKFGADLKTRAEGLGKDFGPRAQTFGNEVTDAARRTSLGLGGVIILIVKIFAYFILGVVLFSLIIGLFAAGVAFIGISPVFNYIFTDGWENALAWIGILLCVWTPIIGIIIFVVRRITKATRNSSLVRYTFLSLWIAGIICLISLFVCIRNDFRYKSSGADEKVALTNPKIDKLEVQLSGYGNNWHGRHWLKLEPFEGIDTDTVFVPNTDIRIIRSLSDSFEVTVLRVSNGSTRNLANDLADKIKYSITQKDSILSLYKGIQINTTDKFRNQRMIITIAVPVGKKIKVDDKIGWRTHIDFGMNSNDWNWRDDYGNEDEMNWETNKEYIMTTKGLKQLDRTGSLIDNNNDDNNNGDIKERMDELKQEIEDKQREMDDKKRELKEQLDEQQRELDEKKRELKLNADSAAEKGKYQKTVVVPNNNNIKSAEGESDQLPSLINVI